jgi:hypothetical protein
VLSAGIAFALPVVSYFKINNDAPATSTAVVTLNNNSIEAAAYRASERQDFAGAQWYAYTTAPTFVLSPGNGAKNVFFQIKNKQGRISQLVYDSIVLQSVPQNSSFIIPKDISREDTKGKNTPPITNPLKDADFKQNIKDISQDRGPATQRDIGVRGLESDRGPAAKDADKKAKDFKGPVITGGRYGDTFGAQRINDKNGSLNPTGVYGWTDPGGYTGGGKGNAGKPANEKDALAAGFLSSKDRVKGTNGYGGNTYTRDTLGSATLYDKDGNLREIRTVSNVDTITVVKFDKEGNVIPKTTTNPMADDSGKGGIVVTPGTTVDQQIRRGMKTGGQVGAPGDGRNPDGGTTTGPSEQSGTSIMMGETKGQEAKKPEEYGGTINMDKVLEINTKINPGK